MVNIPDKSPQWVKRHQMDASEYKKRKEISDAYIAMYASGAVEAFITKLDDSVQLIVDEDTELGPKIGVLGKDAVASALRRRSRITRPYSIRPFRNEIRERRIELCWVEDGHLTRTLAPYRFERLIHVEIFGEKVERIVESASPLRLLAPKDWLVSRRMMDEAAKWWDTSIKLATASVTLVVAVFTVRTYFDARSKELAAQELARSQLDQAKQKEAAQLDREYRRRLSEERIRRLSDAANALIVVAEIDSDRKEFKDALLKAKVAVNAAIPYARQVNIQNVLVGSGDTALTVLAAIDSGKQTTTDDSQRMKLEEVHDALATAVETELRLATY